MSEEQKRIVELPDQAVLYDSSYMAIDDETAGRGTVKFPAKKLMPKIVTVTLAVASWSSNQQTVTVTGVLADESKQVIEPIPATASADMYFESGVWASSQAANALTFKCSKVPSAALTVYVIITEVGA